MILNLEETKKELQILDKSFQRFKALINREDDCFGKDWKEDHSECKLCTIPVVIKGVVKPIWEFCRELTLLKGIDIPLSTLPDDLSIAITEDLKKQKSEVERVMEIFKDFRKTGRPEHEWPEFLKLWEDKIYEEVEHGLELKRKGRMLRVEVKNE